ncbi:hypothetical protein HYFRA_00013812 [Hymenoscyphus fraxineus]|uniref:Uncharacterized protein n=1 Tax=Hymenoscyphus fraxineus TaxID=746836 RepID=A0A9N9LA69_9HELO|nr:hypothetical protein HYFRA_00013812 [Hymenoscyphus fraxineus]
MRSSISLSLSAIMSLLIFTPMISAQNSCFDQCVSDCAQPDLSWQCGSDVTGWCNLSCP